MHRHYKYLVLGGLALPLAIAAGGLVWLSHANLSNFAEKSLARVTGRAVHVGSLRVLPGRWLGVEADDVSLANIAGGSQPQMMTMGHMHAEIRLTSLFSGRTPEIRNLEIRNFSGIFERLPDRTPNWRFGPATSKPESATPANSDTSWVPGLREAHMTLGEIVYRSASGHSYRIGLGDLKISSENDATPTHLTVNGAYDDLPVTLSAQMGPFVTLRKSGTPYPISILAGSGDLTLSLDGTTTDLLNFDGISGDLSVVTATSAPLLTIAGLPENTFEKSVKLKGKFTHTGDFWTIAHGSGQISDSPIAGIDLAFSEGSRGSPDRISGSVAFDKLDINGLVPPTAINPVPAKHTDIDLLAPEHPEPLLDLHLSAREVHYNEVDFSAASLNLVQNPGHVNISSLNLSWLGAEFSASGDISTVKEGSNVRVIVDVLGADIDRFRRQAGLAPVPVNGALSFLIHAHAEGIRTLNQAAQNADVQAVVGMNSGQISRKVIDVASLDVGALLRSSKTTTPVSCMLGALVLHHGEGTVVPLRVYTPAGSIVGEAMFNLPNRWFELAFQTHASGFLALDIPIRVSGPFNNPSLGLAGWSERGRALLKQARLVSSLPTGTEKFMTGRSCLLHAD